MNSFLFNSIEELLVEVNKNTSVSYVVFASYELVKEMAEKVPNHVVLCSSSGEFTPNGYSENAITGFSYDPTIVEVVEILYPPVKGLQTLKKAYEKVKNNPNAFALLFCDGLSAMEEAITTSFFFTAPDFKVIGGSAGDNLNFKETLIYVGRKKVYSVALFFDMKKKTQLIKENLYIPCGKKMLVTEADPVKRIVKTLNNKPAATEYAQMLGIKESELSNYFMSNPLGRKVGKEIFIASPMKVNNDKSITLYCQIIPNTFVEILELADHDSIIKNTIAAVSIKPSFALSINCILRSLHFLESGRWKNVNQELLSISKNHTGFVSYGEQYYKNHFNQTMVMLLVE